MDELFDEAEESIYPSDTGIFYPGKCSLEHDEVSRTSDTLEQSN